VSVRVRYAPSPTGNQHIGGVRTALFNYFFARANKGTFILRIEDTDQTRFRDDALEDIYATFRWLGISWDEGPDKGGPFGPYFQSQRKEIYTKLARELVEKDIAYECYCTEERLDALRKEQAEKKFDPGYDRKCRDLGIVEKDALKNSGIVPVIRLKVPTEGKTVFHDELLGDIKIDNKSIPPDPVLLKSDGFPTYHLANVIDDHLMEITHILRAQEWLPSVPIHIHLYKAFGWTPPVLCHLPMVMGPDGQKLSKRHGATSLIEFRNKGYLPEAIINYVSLLGWAYDDSREFFSTAELEELFTIKKLNKAPAVFNYKKLDWFDGMYLRKRSADDIKSLIVPYLAEEGLVSQPLSSHDDAMLDAIVPLVHERLKTLGEVNDLVRFLFKDVEVHDSAFLIPKNLDAKKTLSVLELHLADVESTIASPETEIETRVRAQAESLGIKLGDFLAPLRIAITGSTQSPPLFDSMKVLGLEKSRRRIERAISLLRS
jgi:glutamyl-tRNA synthetase